MKLTPRGWPCFAGAQTRQAITPVGSWPRGRELKTDDNKLLVNLRECCIVIIHAKILRWLSLSIYTCIYIRRLYTSDIFQCLYTMSHQMLVLRFHWKIL